MDPAVSAGEYVLSVRPDRRAAKQAGLIAVSFHLHLRTVAESEIQDDHTWLAAFMSAAWDSYPGEYAAGIAASIEKIFSLVDDLYAAAGVLDAGADKAWELPIYGGRPVAHDNGADPPLMLLEPPGVRKAADFLATVSFDELWIVAGAKIHGGVFRNFEEAEARQEFLDHHRRLQAFYGRAASAGYAVVKAAWY